MRIQSINPYTEEVMKEFDYESEKQIHNKLKLLKDNKKWAELEVFIRDNEKAFRDLVAEQPLFEKELERAKESLKLHDA